MNGIEKGESIRTGLRKGFQGGSSKIAQRRCCGYNIGLGDKLTINPDEAAVVCRIFASQLHGSSLGRIASVLQASGSCFKRRSVLAASKSKIMASWIGISTPAPMRPLFPTRRLPRFNKKNSRVPKIQRRQFAHNSVVLVARTADCVLYRCLYNT